MKKLTVFLLVFALLASALAVSVPAEAQPAFTAYGDCTGDGKINLTDASAVLRHIAKWGVAINADAADVNVDGRINLGDVSRILKYVAKWDVILGESDTPSYGGEYEFRVMDFGGDEFKFLHYGDSSAEHGDEYIWADSFVGGVIGDAVNERNKLVGDRYNVKITAEECAPLQEAVKRQQAGQCNFDVIYEQGTLSGGAALDGYLYDLRRLAAYEGIDLERDYWVPEATEGLTVADSLFVTTNMVSMNAVSRVSMLYFNKNMMEDLNLTYPYDYVNDGTWTYDVLIEMVTAAEKDVNRDGVMDNNDRFGGISGEALLAGVCAAPLIEDNGDGGYTLIPYTEGMIDQYSKYANILRAVKSLTAEEITEGKDISEYPSAEAAVRYLSFGEGNTLFMKGVLETSGEFAYMKDDYGIAPMPVVSAGDDYVSEIDCSAPMFSMPAQLYDPEMAAVVFDYMAYESERLLLPAYYETTIKTKRIEDTRDYDMLDIITSSARYHWSGIYLWDTVTLTLRDTMLETGNFASTAQRYGEECQAEIDEVVRRLTALG